MAAVLSVLEVVVGVLAVLLILVLLILIVGSLAIVWWLTPGSAVIPALIAWWRSRRNGEPEQTAPGDIPHIDPEASLEKADQAIYDNDGKLQ